MFNIRSKNPFTHLIFHYKATVNNKYIHASIISYTEVYLNEHVSSIFVSEIPNSIHGSIVISTGPEWFEDSSNPIKSKCNLS